MESIETSDKKTNAKGAWPHLTFSPFYGILILVCGIEGRLQTDGAEWLRRLYLSLPEAKMRKHDEKSNNKEVND